MYLRLAFWTVAGAYTAYIFAAATVVLHIALRSRQLFWEQSWASASEVCSPTGLRASEAEPHGAFPNQSIDPAGLDLGRSGVPLEKIKCTADHPFVFC